jgi:hypothetical protein
MMDYDPDPRVAYLQGHYGTKAEGDAFAADIEKLAALAAPYVEITHDSAGGWNLWIWG